MFFSTTSVFLLTACSFFTTAFPVGNYNHTHTANCTHPPHEITHLHIISVLHEAADAKTDTYPPIAPLVTKPNIINIRQAQENATPTPLTQDPNELPWTHVPSPIATPSFSPSPSAIPSTTPPPFTFHFERTTGGILILAGLCMLTFIALFLLIWSIIKCSRGSKHVFVCCGSRKEENNAKATELRRLGTKHEVPLGGAGRHYERRPMSEVAPRGEWEWRDVVADARVRDGGVGRLERRGA